MKQWITKNINRVYRQVIMRPIPHSLVSWRFLLPNPSWKIKLHRRVFLQAWPQLPRLAYSMIFIYSSATWLLWFGWKNIYISFKHNRQLVQKKYKLSALQQLSGLLNAAFLNGIPAYAYYQFKLFKVSSEQWLDYVYKHELPHWHSIVSPNVSSGTHKLLSNKYFFSEALSKKGLATVITIKKLDCDNPVTGKDIFNKQSIFIKPNIGSRSEGCLTLHYYPETKGYELVGDGIDEAMTKKVDILAFVQKAACLRQLIVQPLLNNHPLIKKYSKTETLMTLRVITACLDNQESQVVSALLEIPSEERKGRFYLIAIECDTGLFIDSSEYYLRPAPLFVDTIQRMHGKKIPFWSDVIALCKQAHQHCEGLISIGWDVVITPNGVLLLEGNTNWGISQHQIANNIPTLNSRLGDMYNKKGHVKNT